MSRVAGWRDQRSSENLQGDRMTCKSASTTARPRAAISVNLSLLNELRARHHLRTGMVLSHMRHIAVIVRDTDHSSNHVRGVPYDGFERLDSHAQSPATATLASKGTSDETVGLWPPSTATHSRTLSAKMTTTEIMKKPATPASR